MKIKKTKINGIYIIKGEKHQDNRGYLRELVVEKKIKKNLNFKSHQFQKKMSFEVYIFKLKNLRENLYLSLRVKFLMLRWIYERTLKLLGNISQLS